MKFGKNSLKRNFLGVFILLSLIILMAISGVSYWIIKATTEEIGVNLWNNQIIEVQDVLNIWFKYQSITIVFGIILIFVSSILIDKFLQKIVNRINNLSEIMDYISQGKLQVKATVTEDEIGILGRNINQIIEEIKLLNSDFDSTMTQLELAEISVYENYKQLQEEKEKVEQTTIKLERANEEINLLNEKLQTENIGLNEELKEINDRLNQFLEAVPVGIIVLDKQGNNYYNNYKAQQLLGKSFIKNNQGIIITESYPIYISRTQELCPIDHQLGIQALRKGKPYTSSVLEIHSRNRIIPIESWETPIYNQQGEVTYAIVAFQDITERKKAEAEKLEFTEKLLRLNQANERFVPREFLQLLRKESILDVQLGDNIEGEMTVLFTDIRGFTTLSEKMSPEDNFKFINAFLSRMAPAISANHGFIDKYIGDAIMALFSRSADDAVKAGIEMLEKLSRYNLTRQRPERPPLYIGIGINTGSMMLGTVGGNKRMEGTVISDSVNLASRLERLTKRYQASLLISHHTFGKLEKTHEYDFRLIDRVQVRGKSTLVGVYEIFDADEENLRQGKLKTKSMFEEAVFHYHSNSLEKAETLFHQCLKANPEDPVSKIYLTRCANYNPQNSDINILLSESE
jgi:adenylate cyclase